MYWQLVICFLLTWWLVVLLEQDAEYLLHSELDYYHMFLAEHRVNAWCEEIRASAAITRDAMWLFEFAPNKNLNINHFKEQYMNQWKCILTLEPKFISVEPPNDVKIDNIDSAAFNKLKEDILNQWKGLPV